MRDILSSAPFATFAPRAAAALAILAGSAALALPPFTMTLVVVEGSDVPGVGAVSTVTNVMVNNGGSWLVEADTNNPDTNTDVVVLKDGLLAYRENDPLTNPPGALIGSFDDFVLNNNGNSGWNWFLDNQTTTTDSGIFYNGTLVFQEGTISAATGFNPGTPYIGFFGTKMNDSNQIFVVASVDDPLIATTVDRALVRVDYNAAAGTYTEEVIAKESDTLNTIAIIDFSTDAATFAFNNAGTPLYCAELSGGTVDAIFRGGAVVAQEGQPSGIEDRNWEVLNDRGLDLNNNNDWVIRANLTGATTDDEVIVKNGTTIIAREGAPVPASIGAFTFVGFGTGPVLMDDSGNVVYYATWNDPATTINKGLFWNNELLIQDGVTVIDGQVVTTVRGVSDGFAMSENGQHIIARVVLTGGIEAAVKISFSSCGTSDFNGDGDFGTDQDIEAFFACLAGNCCPTCFPGGADFNGDGDIGTDQDIEAFFRVLGGGNC
jgi:hypothetical protein